MAREIKSKEFIQEWLSDEINGSCEVVDDGRYLRVATPVWSAEAADGCNWLIAAWKNAQPYAVVIQEAVTKARARFNLPEPE